MPLSIIDIRAEKPERQRLIASALDNPFFKTSPSSSTQRIRDFVQIQQSHEGLFKKEGEEYLSKWANKDACGEKPGDVIESAVQQSGAFASPILKPRNPTVVPRSRQAPHSDTSQANQEQNNNIAQPISSKESAPAGIGVKCTAPAADKRAKRSRSHASTTEENKENVPLDVADVEEADRAKRMAMRRERKRTKREMVKSPTPSSSSVISELPDNISESSETEACDPKKANKVHRKKTKKHKGNKVLPGTALMQKFSAQNLGQERITLKPSKNLGFLRNGRSSSNLDLQTIFKIPGRRTMQPKTKPKPSLTTDPAFSQYAFSNKKISNTSKLSVDQDSKKKSARCFKLPPHPESGSRKPGEDGLKVESKIRSSNNNTAPPSGKNSRRSDIPSQGRRASNPSSSSSEHESDVESRHSHTQPERYWSPPWVIDGELIGEPAPDHPPAAKSESSFSQVVDVSGKWGLLPNRDKEPQASRPESDTDDNPCKPDVSLEDNNSVSQPEVRSRYFVTNPVIVGHRQRQSPGVRSVSHTRVEEKKPGFPPYDDLQEALPVEQALPLTETQDSRNIAADVVSEGDQTQSDMKGSDLQNLQSSPNKGSDVDELLRRVESELYDQLPIYDINGASNDSPELIAQPINSSGCQGRVYLGTTELDPDFSFETNGQDSVNLIDTVSTPENWARRHESHNINPYSDYVEPLHQNAWSYSDDLLLEERPIYLNEFDEEELPPDGTWTWHLDAKQNSDLDPNYHFNRDEEEFPYPSDWHDEDDDQGSMIIDGGAQLLYEEMDGYLEDEAHNPLSQFNQGKALLLGMECVDGIEEGTNDLSEDFCRNHWRK
ncbi:hypothetical protein FRC03_005581 [Tulasnella sp. 419]|nr:hypothetical protein FRC03_005581 [Tulasnella sp. 419]